MGKRLNANNAKWYDVACRIVAAADVDSAMYLPSEVHAAQQRLCKDFGRVPPVGVLFQLFGDEQAQSLLERIIAERRAYLAALNDIFSVELDDAVCHQCGSRCTPTEHEFGLVKVREVERDWSAAVASVLLSIVTVPLLGIGGLSGPAKTRQGHVLRLWLQLCEACQGRKKAFFGGVKLSKEDYARHPRWDVAHRHGYNEFIPPNELSSWK